MKERPILFSAPMVRAILEGRKTQTRRVMKPQPQESFGIDYNADGSVKERRSYGWSWCKGTGWPHVDIFEGGAHLFHQFSRYGKPGERLWVRETFALESNRNVGGADYPPPHKDGRPINWLTCEEYGRYWQQAHYRATDPAPALVCEEAKCRQCGSEGADDFGAHWKPSIHMPRWASRITLEMTGVRVELLQDISTQDAEAEGWPGPDAENTIRSAYPIAWYSQLWAQINGAGSWDLNPWVWVIEFKRVPA